ncbi:MAG: KTSC domain-containing protein [Anaerolineales bacterium]|nr:KTSC domain-containing protein [Anaerolineales bacterium]
MKRTAVSSSNLTSVGYDPVNKILEIEFNTGTIYQYFDVPQSEHIALMGASSHGSYFYHNIRDSYNYKRIR